MTDRPTSSVSIGFDVVAGTAWLALAWSVVTLSLPAPVRGLVVAPLLLVVPGYAVQLGLFAGRRSPTGLERALLSVALSVAGSIAVGLALGATVGVTAVGSLACLSTLTLVGFAVAVARSPDRAFALAYPRTARPTALSTGLPTPATVGTETDSLASQTVWTVAVVAGVGGLLAAGFLLGVAQPPGSATLSLAPESGSWNGSTTGVTAGDPVRVSLSHSYPGTRSFVVVAVLQRPDGDGFTRVRGLDRYQVTLGAGERWSRVHRPDLDSTERVRLTYRLYRGDAATGDPRTDVHLWFGPGNATDATSATPARVEAPTEGRR